MTTIKMEVIKIKSKKKAIITIIMDKIIPKETKTSIRMENNVIIELKMLEVMETNLMIINNILLDN